MDLDEVRAYLRDHLRLVTHQTNDPDDDTVYPTLQLEGEDIDRVELPRGSM